MISGTSLVGMSQELFVYDHVQQGWEQEPNGFEASAKHVLTHLAKNLLKDFDDPRALATEIAPDSAMYALRLARWNTVEPVVYPQELVVSDAHIDAVKTASVGFPGMPLHRVSYMAAVAALARHAHGYDHERERATTIQNQPQAVHKVGGLLLYSANLQAYHADFSLPQAFTDRLQHLRKLFGIPQPETTGPQD